MTYLKETERSYCTGMRVLFSLSLSLCKHTILLCLIAKFEEPGSKEAAGMKNSASRESSFVVCTLGSFLPEFVTCVLSKGLLIERACRTIALRAVIIIAKTPPLFSSTRRMARQSNCTMCVSRLPALTPAW